MSEKLRTFDEFMDDVFIINSFITIGLSTSTYIYKVKAYSSKLVTDIGDGKNIPNEIDIFFQPLTIPDIEKKLRIDKIVFYT